MIMEGNLPTICFINKTTFMGLLGTDNAEDIGFEHDNIDQLGYIDQNWKIEFGEFDQEKAEKANYLLVSDEFPLEENYQPKKMFKFLIHSRTNRKRRIEPFETIFPCYTVTEEREEIGSEFGKIAKNIISINLHKNE
jgi:hypothetical protein